MSQYKKETSAEKSVLKDGIHEMMSEVQYQYWAGKPKNGGLSALEASAKWQEKYNHPSAITDKLGENPRYPCRLIGF